MFGALVEDFFFWIRGGGEEIKERRRSRVGG